MTKKQRQLFLAKAKALLLDLGAKQDGDEVSPSKPRRAS